MAQIIIAFLRKKKVLFFSHTQKPTLLLLLYDLIFYDKNYFYSLLPVY